MPGTKAGSHKRLKTIRERYGDNFFKEVVGNKYRKKMIERFGSYEAYIKHQKEIASRGGKARRKRAVSGGN